MTWRQTQRFLIAAGISGPGKPARPNATDATVSDLMQRYWTNFAKTGTPNGPGLPEWPAFKTPRQAYLHIADERPVMKEGLRRPFCDLYAENVKRSLAR